MNQNLRASEGIAAPQSRENLQTFARSEEGLCSPPLPPPLSNLHFQTWQFYVFLGALSSGVHGFSRACPYQKLKKKVQGSIVTSLKTLEFKYVQRVNFLAYT